MDFILVQMSKYKCNVVLRGKDSGKVQKKPIFFNSKPRVRFRKENMKKGIPVGEGVRNAVLM